ncbi:MAG: hypothetical protein KatS3mg111_2164 [Pirellulaceae bacterium]|nr:MAG: hypothetical protein KatS3mg111_2164 [Pirellulaceae bacterium]
MDEQSTPKPWRTAGSGCLYAVYVIALSTALLLVNAIFALTLFSVVPKPASKELAARVGQFVYFVVPLILLILEWHLIDRIYRLFDRGNRRTGERILARRRGW